MVYGELDLTLTTAGRLLLPTTQSMEDGCVCTTMTCCPELAPSGASTVRSVSIAPLAQVDAPLSDEKASTSKPAVATVNFEKSRSVAPGVIAPVIATGGVSRFAVAVVSFASVSIAVASAADG